MLLVKPSEMFTRLLPAVCQISLELQTAESPRSVGDCHPHLISHMCICPTVGICTLIVDEKDEGGRNAFNPKVGTEAEIKNKRTNGFLGPRKSTSKRSRGVSVALWSGDLSMLFLNFRPLQTLQCPGCPQSFLAIVRMHTGPRSKT